MAIVFPLSTARMSILPVPARAAGRRLMEDTELIKEALKKLK
jgi:hypothetical protein